MSVAGLLLLGMVGLWLLYLVPVWLHARAERAAERRTERALRIAEEPPVWGHARRVVLTAGRPVVNDASPVRLTPRVAARLQARTRRARAAARLRGTVTLLSGFALAATLFGAVMGGLPWWSVGLASLWLSSVLVTGMTAASRRRRRRAARQRHARVARAVLPVPYPDRPVYDDLATEQVVGSAGAPGDARAGDREGGERTEEEHAGPKAAEAGESTGTVAHDETWTPVDVPAPVYTTKPVAHRPPATPWSVPPAARAAVARVSVGGLTIEGSHQGTAREEDAADAESGAAAESGVAATTAARAGSEAAAVDGGASEIPSEIDLTGDRAAVAERGIQSA